MAKHIIQRATPVVERVPLNIPPQKKYHTILADPQVWRRDHPLLAHVAGAD